VPRKSKEVNLPARRIVLYSVNELKERYRLSESEARQILENAWKELNLVPRKAAELLEELTTHPRITTGSRNLDELLGGGVETRTITEFFGEYGSGKSQLCHQLSVNVQLPKGKGGLDGGAVYIDTEGTFRPDRIKQMADAVGLNAREVLGNIVFIRALTVDQQMTIVENLPDIIEKNGVKLVVVDSITTNFRAEFPGRENLARRQQLLNKHLNKLRIIAWVYEVAVVITNQVMARPDVFYGDPTQAVGGHVLGHAPGVRVYLKKSRGNRRIARVVDAPHLPEGEAMFEITPEGIRDPKD
jgi:DNA repair protein RadA